MARIINVAGNQQISPLGGNIARSLLLQKLLESGQSQPDIRTSGQAAGLLGAQLIKSLTLAKLARDEEAKKQQDAETLKRVFRIGENQDKAINPADLINSTNEIQPSQASPVTSNDFGFQVGNRTPLVQSEVTGQREVTLPRIGASNISNLNSRPNFLELLPQGARQTVPNINPPPRTDTQLSPPQNITLTKLLGAPLTPSQNTGRPIPAIDQSLVRSPGPVPPGGGINLAALLDNPRLAKTGFSLLLQQRQNQQANQRAQAAIQAQRNFELQKLLQQQNFTAGQNEAARQAVQDNLLKELGVKKEVANIRANRNIPGKTSPLPADVFNQQLALNRAQTPQFIETTDSTGRKVQKNLLTGEIKSLPEPRVSVGQKAADQEFGKDFAKNFASGGISDAVKNLSQLEEVATRLDAIDKGQSTENLTGPALGRVPDFIKSFTNPESINIREQVEEVVQRNLRVILGAQFTANEGAALIARAFNPNLDEATNAKRIRRLVKSMRSALEAKQRAAEYFVEHDGTLAGFKGNTDFSIEEFDKALDDPRLDETPKRRSSDNQKNIVVDF